MGEAKVSEVVGEALELGAELERLMALKGPYREDMERGDPRRVECLKCRAWEERVREKLIELFCEVRGWKHSHSDFNIQTLAQRKMHGSGHPYTDSLQFSRADIDFDHPYWFRTPDRRAAGVAYHAYNLPRDQGKEGGVREWALGKGLRVEFPEDFPSWWFPPWTRLVVLRPAR